MASAYGLAPVLTPEGEDVNANQSTLILSVSVVLIVVPTCIVFLRFIARLLSKAGLWWDDWLVLLGLLLAIALSSLQIYSLSFGFGEHIAVQGDIISRFDVAQYWFKLFYAYEHIYTFSVFFCKMSILLFYSRIFKERRFIFWMRVLIVVTVLHFLGGELAIIMECIPVAALWDPTISGQCIDIIKFFDAHGSTNAALDLAILVLPLPWIWSLEIERHHKWALSGVFMLGSLVVIAAVVRVVVLSQLSVEDITWEFVNGALWTAAEPSIAVTSASLPILRSLWIWNRRKSSARYGGNTPDSYVESNNRNLPGRPPGFQKMASLRGHSPVNELPAGVQHAPGFGNHVSVGAGSSHDRGETSTRKLSDEDSSRYAGLPIMHPHPAAAAALHSHRPPQQQPSSQTWRPQRPAYAQHPSHDHYPPPSERSIASPHRSTLSSSHAQSSVMSSAGRNSRSTLLSSNHRSTAHDRSELSGN